MSKNQYSEYEPKDSEVTDLLDELYPEPAIVCGQKFTQSYALKRLDRIAFDSFASDAMNWYKCDVCDTVHKTDESEDEARECCQRYCDNCGADLPDDGASDLCDDCMDNEDEEL